MPRKKNPGQAADHPWRRDNIKNSYPTTKLANYVGDPLPELFGQNYNDFSNVEHAEKIC